MSLDDVGVFIPNKSATAREVIEDMEKHGMRPMSLEELNSIMNQKKDDTVDLEEGEDYTVENDGSKKPKELNK